jgi:hypothetical protein
MAKKKAKKNEYDVVSAIFSGRREICPSGKSPSFAV